MHGNLPPPPPENEDSHNLSLAWHAVESLLKVETHRAVSLREIYSVWRRPPFGIKDGLLPVLAVAFILSRRKVLALYREGIFQPRLSELDVDYILGDPADVQLRWMMLSETSRRLLSDMAEVVRELDGENALNDLEPIDVARGLVTIYDRLPPWVGRTQRLSPNAKDIRTLLKKANDPNRLIFDDIPSVLSDGKNGSVERVASRVGEGLTELRKAFPAMLSRMKEILLAELEVPYASPPMLAELRARAENALDLAGDHRLRAFIVRLSRFEGKDEDMESLASMAINKPPRDWVDPDIDRALVALAEMAQRFVRLEAFAHVNGRKDKRHAMAMVVGLDGRPATLHAEFDVTDLDRPGVESLLDRMTSTLRDSGEERRNVILAALSELSAQYLQTTGNAYRPMERPLT